MFVKSLKNCEQIIAGDNTKLREIFNPLKSKELELGYSLAYAEVSPNETTFPHSLKSTEVYYIISGRGEMHINDEMSEVHPEDTIYIPPRAVQFIKNIGTEALKFLCMVEPAWKAEDEIINGK
jgi:mannose-6-phosphate isomerase-like protein (cupin superfamily)